MQCKEMGVQLADCHSLKNQWVSEPYIGLSKKIYNKLRGIEMRRVTNQGNPLSSLLFISVLQHVMERDMERKGWGSDMKKIEWTA